MNLPLKLVCKYVHCEEVSDKILQTINDHLSPSEWKPLARKLEFTETEIDEIDHDYCQKSSVKEGSLKMLYRWRNKNAYQETELLLLNALKDIGRTDIVKKLEKQTTTREVLYDRNAFERLHELQEHMVDCYKDPEFPRDSFFKDRILFLNKQYIDLTLMKKDKLGRKEEAVININEIFKKPDGSFAKRILIESNHGRGKTILCLKLSSDWANHVGYIRQRFVLVFNISLQHYEGDLNKNILNTMKEKKEITDEEKSKLINSEREYVLLILDGFDYLTESLKQNLLNELKTKEYQNMTVILTCRIEANLEVTDNESVSGINSEIFNTLSFWSKRIEIKGISQDKKENFILNYLSPDDLKNYKKYACWFHENPSQFSSPLFLLLFVMLIEDKEFEEISTRTKFFEKFLNYLVKRELIKDQKVNWETKVDIFDPSDANGSYFIPSLLEFGKLALRKLSQNSTSFTREEILSRFKIVEELGILERKISYERHRFITRFHCFPEILKFLSAFYVANQLKHSPINCVENFSIINSLKDEFIYKKNSFITPFIVGLLGTQAHLFFQFLKPNFSLEQLSNILLELEYSDKKNLESFFSLNIPNIISSFKILLSLNYPVLESLIFSIIIHFVFLTCLHYWRKKIFLGSLLRILLHPL